MTSPDTENWNIGSKSGLVSTGSHKLYLQVTGPDSLPGQPVILPMTGVTNTISTWSVIQRLTSPFARLLAYDRSGPGLSEKSPNPPSAPTIAKELSALLAAANTPPPYITLGHSWGRIFDARVSSSDAAGRSRDDLRRRHTSSVS